MTARDGKVTLSIAVSAAPYIVLRADGDEPLWPVVGDAESARLTPLAITNPLFVDRDGDGVYRR